MAYFGGELSSRRNFPMTEPKNVEIYMANPILVMHIAIFRLCIMYAFSLRTIVVPNQNPCITRFMHY